MSFSPDDVKKLRENLLRSAKPLASKKAPSEATAALPGHSRWRGKSTFARSKPADRTWGGVTYASKGEMEFAKKLAIERAGNPGMWYVRQPIFDLAGVKYRPDFLVVRPFRYLTHDFTPDGGRIFGLGEETTLYEIKPWIKNDRFRAEALRRFKRDAAQVKALWGVDVVLVET